MTGEVDAMERFVRAALLGSAMAAEIQRILRDNVKPAEVAADGTIMVEVPSPESTVLYAVLDAAAACFGPGAGGAAGASPAEARQAMVEPVLQLASIVAGPGAAAPNTGWQQPSGIG